MERISFRRVTRTDFPLIASWLAQPHVARWWNHEWTPDAVERDFGSSVDGSEPGEDYLAVLDGRPFGLIQWSRFRDYPVYRDELASLTEVPDDAFTVDYLIGVPDLTGRGLGRQMVAAFVEHVWRSDSTANPVIVPVPAANEASWRTLLGAGFHLVARGNLEPDNPIDDPMHEILRLDRQDDVGQQE